MTGAATSKVADQFAQLLERETGQILAEGRRWRIETLLRPVLRQRDLQSLDELFHAIERDPRGPLKAATIDALLNHESSFFRDFSVFQTIEKRVIPQLVAQSREQYLRIWSVGCSTGQEAYSLAMMAKRMPILEGWRVSIQAMDVSRLAIEQACRGRFSRMDMQRGLPINDLLQ